MTTEWHGERAMRKPVCEWLTSLGYVPVFEVWNCDIVAAKWNERIGRRRPTLHGTIGVELKLKSIQSVLAQCKAAQFRYNLAYAAMPESTVMRMRAESFFEFQRNGYGLLAVTNTVREVLRPKMGMGGWSNRTAGTLWRRRDEWKGRLVRTGNEGKL